jgi:hypothetical protein
MSFMVTSSPVQPLRHVGGFSLIVTRNPPAEAVYKRDPRQKRTTQARNDPWPQKESDDGKTIKSWPCSRKTSTAQLFSEFQAVGRPVPGELTASPSSPREQTNYIVCMWLHEL